MKIDLLERRETDPAVIPKAALAQGELLGYEKLEVHIQPLSAVVLPGRMTALELLRAAEGLWEVSRTLLEILEDACGPCEECQDACPMAAYNGGPLVRVEPSALEEAGISPQQKLCCVGDPTCGAVHVMPSEYRHDLSDVSQRSLIWLKNAGLCLDQLNDYLMEETVLYGDDA